MTAKSFVRLCDGLIGSWSGVREGTELKNERVRSVWEWALRKAYLQEHWFTSGSEGVLGLEAIAFFRMFNELPGEFAVAYKSRGFAYGDSSWSGEEWVLTHAWLGAEGKAEIRLRLLDRDTYQQEVVAIDDKGESRVLSKAMLSRE